MLKVFITNLAKYNEGYLYGKWVTLPKDEDELQEDVNEVLVDNEELFITDWESDYKREIEKYLSVFIINQELQELEIFNEDVIRLICLIADAECQQITEVIEEYKDGKYIIIKATNFEELGIYLNVNGLLGYEIPSHLDDYIDYERLGEDWLLNTNYIDLSNEGFYITY